MHTPFSLTGYRVGLRPICVDDVDAIMEWINDPAVTRNFANMSRTITRSQERDFLDGMIASDTDRLYAIVGSDGTHIGNAGIHKIYWPARNGRLGLVVGHTDAQGQGLGQEALRLLITLGFEQLGLHKLWMVHYRTNDRMRHIAIKHGFQREGLLRDEYFHAGTFHDMERHGLLEHEYRDLRGSWVTTGS